MGENWARVEERRGGVPGSLDCSLNLLPKLLSEMRQVGRGRREAWREREDMNVS